MLFVCYPKCTTCQKARRFLEARGASFTVRDIKEERPTAEELSAWRQRSGLRSDAFLTRAGWSIGR